MDDWVILSTRDQKKKEKEKRGGGWEVELECEQDLAESTHSICVHYESQKSNEKKPTIGNDKVYLLQNYRNPINGMF